MLLPLEKLWKLQLKQSKSIFHQNLIVENDSLGKIVITFWGELFTKLLNYIIMQEADDPDLEEIRHKKQELSVEDTEKGEIVYIHKENVGDVI